MPAPSRDATLKGARERRAGLLFASDGGDGAPVTLRRGPRLEAYANMNADFVSPIRP